MSQIAAPLAAPHIALPPARLLVVVPMKDPAQAKTRLSGTLSPARRADLARTLFALTLQRLARVRRSARHRFDIATVTASPQIAAQAQAAGMQVIDQGPQPGLNAAIAQAAALAQRAGYAAMAVLPGDLAQPAPADLLALLDRPAHPSRVLLCESSDGGTNALLLPLPARMGFCYGPGSFRAHRASARAAGLTPITLALDSLRHDIDCGADLMQLLPGPLAALAEARP